MRKGEEEFDGDYKFFRNVGSHTDYTALYPRSWQLTGKMVIICRPTCIDAYGIVIF
jgi:hypothetical protein